MHRHGYNGRKLQREAGPRRALVRGLVTSLVLHEQITTTEAKAKEIAPQFERLVTKAKTASLPHQRQIRAFLLTDKATDKLITEIAPAFAKRAGGYTRVVKLGNRLGDNAKMAAVQLTEKVGSAAELASGSDSPRSKTASGKASAKKTVSAKKDASKKSAAKPKAEAAS
jgi:large subunit ribosomal protein L17